MRLRDLAAVGEHLRVAARVEADVHLAEQSRRQDRRDRVARELIAAVDLHRYARLIGLRIERDPLHATDDDTRRLDRRAQLEAADVVERRLQMVARGATDRREVADLERQECDRSDADDDEDADPQIDCRAVHTPMPRNMKTVRTKSSARMASELATTVRVVAVDTPSAVGRAL